MKMKRSSVLAALLVVTTVVPAGVVTGANEPPLPDAGLDQTVQRGSQVLLDGAGSRDPDGRIVSYEWTITTPDGRTIAPTNSSTPHPTFEATLRGRYEVSLTVTDDDGRSRSDTMYVTVERGRDPTVQLSGPATSTAGSEETYTASFDRGAAPLTRIAWRVDGVRVANRSLTPGQTAASLSHAFGTTESHSVSVTVYDTDGQNASATHRLTTQSVSTTPPPNSGPSTSIASRQSPTVVGPQLVTGAQPLSATYRLSDVSAPTVQSVTWRTERQRVDGRQTASLQWAPGDHTLYAVVHYTDGSRDVARFSGGETAVTADPEPNVSVQNLVTSGRLAGDAVAEDGYGNLQSVNVEVDGEAVARWPRNLVDTGKRSVGERRVGFEKQVETGQQSTITVTATDDRGQTVTVSKEVSATGTPEVIESGFVNTPVDSYHERIDPERYVAKHVMRVDLNGVDPENVSIKAHIPKGNIVQSEDGEDFERSRIYLRELDYLLVETHWSAQVPNSYPIDFRLRYQSRLGEVQTDVLHVRNSPPEVQLKVTQSGVSDQTNEWGIVVDASSSFDPDGTRLNYIWSQGAEPIADDNTTAKFDSLRRAKLEVFDQDGRSSIKSHSFHQYYVPQYVDVTPIGEGPYKPNETVAFEVRTKSYGLSKNRYEIDLGTTVSGLDAQVSKWHRIDENHLGEPAVVRHWEGTIRVPASKLRGASSAEVAVFNEENPERIRVSNSVPTVTILTNLAPVRRDVSVDNVRYLLSHEQTDTQRVDSARTRDRLIRFGYELEETVETGTEHVLEKQVKVRDAQYETEHREFYSASARRQFVGQSPAWTTGGSSIESNTWTTTETEWRDSRSGSGEFTGETRQKVVDDADYKREHKYEYTREVEKTGTRTDWETRTRTIEETRTRTVERCYRFGCITYDQTYEVEVEEEYEVRVEEEYTYTVEETEMYWAFNSYHYSHEPTGESRLVKIAPAEYETQYKYRFEETHEETYRVYGATRQVQVESAQYGWKRVGTVEGRMNAYRQSRDPDYRIADSSTSYEWVLTKTLGQSKVISSTYQDESNVLETRARVRGTLVERMLNPETGGFITTDRSEFEEEYSERGLATRADIINNVRTRNNDDCERTLHGLPYCRGDL